ncbi:hypothetical protein [Marinobacter sp. X15-166B]|uniref:hypothetical protein n=1 Tax=Marinobacter sp. X15-166B TaxID=1897620 RepID=UPI00114D1BB1|nr:hypothetical protein [Marinobacter sp. X15-166B]
MSLSKKLTGRPTMVTKHNAYIHEFEELIVFGAGYARTAPDAVVLASLAGLNGIRRLDLHGLNSPDRGWRGEVR